MKMYASYAMVLVLTFFSPKADGFSFSVKSAGALKVTATPGDLISYNAHLVVTKNTTLSFHVSLPHFNTPILNVEEIIVIGKGKNIMTSQEVLTHSESNPNSFRTRSQSSIDFGNVTHTDGSSKPGDNLVVQVQARLLSHANVTSGKVFWLYFGMHYLNDAVWVIGKSVKVDLQTGPADIGVSLVIPEGHKQVMSEFKFAVDIYHLPGSKASASSLTITLSTPSALTSPIVNAMGASPAFGVSTGSGVITITFTEPFAVGQRGKLFVGMTYTGSDEGKFVYGNIYGSFQYETDPDSSDTCNELQTVVKKEALQLAFKFYAEIATCNSVVSIDSVTEANSAQLPCCPARFALHNPTYANDNWEVWMDSTGARLADEYIQFSFGHKTTVQRIATSGFKKKNQFVRSFHVSYSQNGAHWKYITHMGKKKEFDANTDAKNVVNTIFPTPLTVWFLRVHIVRYSSGGAGMKIKVYGCEDTSVTKPYEVYQRGFIAGSELVILCNVHPDRMQAKPNCFESIDEGSTWTPMHPSIVNVIGLDATGQLYALGVTSADTPIYMKVISSQSVRVISETDWNAAKTGCTLPKVIPLYPVHGNPLYQLTDTSTAVGAVSYVASPEGLLKSSSGSYEMIASWVEYKTALTNKLEK